MVDRFNCSLFVMLYFKTESVKMSLSAVVCETYYDENTKTWYGPKQKDFYGTDMTLGDAIISVLHQNRKKVLQYVDNTGEELTGEELLRNALRICKTFVKLGVQPRDVMGLYASNSHYLSSIVLAVWLSGAAINAVYDLFDQAELEVIYKVTRPKFIFCDVANYQAAVNVNKNLNLNARIYVVNGEVANLPNVNDLLGHYSYEELEEFVPPCSNIDGDYNAAITCSSGTTGPPKGVCMSHKAILNQKIHHTLCNDSVAFSFSSLYWVSGLWTLKESLLRGCLRIVTTKPFTPEYCMDLVKRHQITHMISSSVHMTEVALLNKPEWKDCMKSIDTLICGGAKVPKVTYETIITLLDDNTKKPGFVVAYGMTELSALLTNNYVSLGRGLNGSDGKLLPNKIVRILDKDGKALGINEHGEIHIKFRYNWLGYMNNQAACEKVFKDQWFATGDVGYFDEQGFLHICARDQDVYKSFNIHIYPEKIENVILRIPGVKEVCVFGIPHLVYTNVSACAVVRAKTPEGEKLTEDLIKKVVSEELQKYYHLCGGVYFFDTLPKTGSDKIKRSHIRDLTWYGPKQKDFYGSDMTLGDAIITVLQQNRKKVLQYVDNTGEELTGEQLLKNALSICKTFVKLGVQPRDVMGLYATNSHYLSSIILAVWLSGAAINAVTRPKFIFCDVANYQAAVNVNENLNLNARIYVVNGEVANLPNVKELLGNYSDEELEEFVPPCTNIDGDYSAAISCSSGTTGPPKGVHIHTLRTDSVAFSFSSIYWVSGFWTLKECLLRGCLRIVTTKPFTPDYFMDVVKRHQVTHMINSTVNMTEIALLNKPEWKEYMKSVDTIICGGSKVPQVTYETINALVDDNTKKPGFVVAYGMTELSALLTNNYVLLGRGLKGSDGKLLPNKVVRILDKDGRALGINEHGEIHIKFQYNWLGYMNNQAAFEKVFKDQWFSTGDMGYFDEQGFLHICARDQDVYKSFNLHIYPEKIENVILRIPGVKEVCVFGIPNVMYANVSACAVVRAKTPEGEKLTEDLIKKVVSEELQEFYHLRGGVYFFDTLPKTGSDKIKRSHIRDLVIKDMNVEFD
ncbi:Luciferin 4-monooxygenase [Lucilia cuprina]|nr:Luciferin 4-monooxygenase [Lucilia cuprina]